MDVNAPTDMAAALRTRCEQRGGRYLRHDRCLAPNEARGLALAEVETPYVIFIDNDVFVSRGRSPRPR